MIIKSYYKQLIFFVCLFFAYKAYSLRPYAHSGDSNWGDFITESCSPTFDGLLKKTFYGDLDFWVHVVVEMEGWKEREFVNLRDYCGYTTEYGNSSKDNDRFLACQGRWQVKVDWYKRCYPIAVRSCRNAGGRC